MGDHNLHEEYQYEAPDDLHEEYVAPEDHGPAEEYEDLPDEKSEGLPAWVWLAAGLAAVVLLLVVLAACGVFSSDAKDNPVKNNAKRVAKRKVQGHRPKQQFRADLAG